MCISRWKEIAIQPVCKCIMILVGPEFSCYHGAIFCCIQCSLLIQDNLNRTLCGKVPYSVDQQHLDDPHVKANLLFQVSRFELMIGNLEYHLIFVLAFL